MAAILPANGCTRAEPPALPPPEVLVTDVIQKDVPIYSEWVGTTVGFVNARIMPQVQGYLLKQAYKDGAYVKAGQLLFEIDDRSYKAALDEALGDLARQRATLRKYQLDVARDTPLAAQGAVSRQELDDSVQAARASEAQVQAAEAAVERARLNLGWTRVYSPIDGLAGIAPVQIGDLLSPTTVLTTVSQIDPMKVTVPITEREYLRYADQIKQHQEKGAPRRTELRSSQQRFIPVPRLYTPTVRSTATGTVLRTLFPKASCAHFYMSAGPCRPPATRSSYRSARFKRPRACRRWLSSDRTTRSRSGPCRWASKWTDSGSSTASARCALGW
jgi:multidrug efflux pump subunit AcrA (membrane-fusion protein)